MSSRDLAQPFSWTACATFATGHLLPSIWSDQRGVWCPSSRKSAIVGTLPARGDKAAWRSQGQRGKTSFLKPRVRAVLETVDIQVTQMREEQVETAGFLASRAMLHNDPRGRSLMISSWSNKIFTKRPHNPGRLRREPR